jgi:hypothetical protein
MADECPDWAVLIDADDVPMKNSDETLIDVSSTSEPAVRRMFGAWDVKWSSLVAALPVLETNTTSPILLIRLKH